MVENYALVQRPAAFSWEAMTVLTGAVQATAPIQVDFPRPVIIVSAYPSVAVAGGSNALLFPSLDDILIRIEVDTGSERRLTSRFDTTQPNGVNNFPDVTLGSYRDTVGGARVLDLRIGDPGGGRPTLNCTFTWKRPIAGGPYFQDIYVGVVFHTLFVG
jgi:hypothetical protein